MESNKIFLGKIKEIRQYKLIISLPHNKTSICELNNVSLQYRKLLDIMARGEDTNEDEDDSVSSLSEIFTVGQTVQTKVLKGKENKLQVSLIPSDINADINIKHLKSGMKLQVAIQSSEDKGYVLETGISGLNGFLPFVNCPDKSYKLGQIFEACPIVKKGEGISRVVNFIVVNDKLKSKPVTITDFSCILPGMLIETHLKLSNEGNMEGTFQGFPVTVKPDHQLTEEIKAPDQTVCVIGIDCAMKHLDCSLLPHLIPPFKGEDELIATQIGHSVADCSVQKIQKSQVTFSVPNLKYSRAIVKQEQIDIELKGLKIGESTTIRFLDFNLLDNVIQATCLKRLLSLSYFSVNQAKLGEIIKGTVKGYQKIGFAVQISSQLSGFIPVHHLKDSCIKVPSAAFKSGDEIRCRVFHIDHEKNKLVLTVKKSFMTSTLPVVASIDDIEPGMMLDGFVGNVNDYGLLIIMFNNLKGWVRKSDIPDCKNKDLKILFHKGKSVKVRVLKCDKETDKISLSMMDPKEHEEKEEDVLKSSVVVQVGEVYECVVKKVMKNGFNVRLMPFNKAAFLTYEQLSDSREHNALLKAHFSQCESKTMKTNVVIINTESDVVNVSRKYSLISAAKDGRMLTKNAEVTVGSQWLGWVIKRESFGVFVELPTGIVGLISNKNICDQRNVATEPKELLQDGDTVEVKVIEYNAEKPKKSFFSMKMSDTYRAKDHLERGSLSFLANHLDERRFIKSLPACEKVSKMEIGEIVEAKVTSQLEWGFTVTVGDSVPGFVRNAHLPSVALSVGTVTKAVIVDIDLGQQSVELCMTASVVNSVKNKNSSNQVQLKQVIKSDVLAFSSDFVVAMLLDHAHGNIVFIPTKRFWNDVSKEFCWIVNQRNLTVIKRALTADTFIGSLKINEPIEHEEKTKKTTEVVVRPTLKALTKKIRLIVGQQYPVFFLHFNKNKIFFSFSRKQKCFCSILEFSEKLDDLEQLLVNPPSERTLMDRKITITETGRHGTGLAFGHFLKKEVIEKGDEFCCRVTSVVKGRECIVELPFNGHGIIDLSENNQSQVKVVPKMGSVIQCRVDEVGGPKIKLSITKVTNYVEETEITDDVEMVEEPCIKMEEKIESVAVKRPHVNKLPPVGSVPMGTTIKKDECKKALYSEDLPSEEESDSDDSDGEMVEEKKQKMNHQTPAERELSVREAEQRRESKETIKNPQSEVEFELRVFNCPNKASSWTMYMDFVMLTEKNVDKVRSIAERAITTIGDHDVSSRFVVMKKYLDLELDQMIKNEDQQDQLDKFMSLLERCLIARTKDVYIHVCERTRTLKLYELSEKLAKRFVKDFPYEMVSWFQLVLVRFEQRKFDVVKETLVNAERLLKADHYRDLQIRMAQLEIEVGQKNRGTQILEKLMESRPKDESLKKKCQHILSKAGLSSHNEESDIEME